MKYMIRNCVCIVTAFICTILAKAESTDSITAYPHSIQHLISEGLIKDTKIIFVNGDETNRASQDSVESLVEHFYIDQYRQFYDPHAPYFMFLTKDANLAMGIGGRVMLRGWYGWNGCQDSYEFFPYNIQIPKNPVDNRGLDSSASETAIVMTVLGRNKTFGNYMVYVLAGFRDRIFALKDVFIKFNDWTIGYTESTFEDEDALAPTIDAQGPNGQVSKSAMLVRYFHTFKSGWSLAGGLEFPSSAQTVTDGETTKCRDYIPDIVGLGQYQWDGGNSHIRASGILRIMSYRDLLSSRNKNVMGWGTQLSGRWQMFSPFAIYFQGVVGQGIGSYCGDLSEGEYDLVPSATIKGKQIAPLSLGISAGIQYDFSEKLFACIAVGESRYYNNHANPDEYKYGLYGAVNVFYNITPRIQTGAEYLIGKRMNFDGTHATANRAELMLSFSF